MIGPIANYRRRVAVTAGLLVTGLIAGCGGSGSSGGSGATSSSATTAAEALSTSKSMGATSAAALSSASTSASNADSVEGVALSAGATSQASAANDLLTTTNSYLALTKAESIRSAPATDYSKTIGGLTVTVVVTVQSVSTAGFVITLNGSPSGSGAVVTYSNFVFATGTITRGTNAGKPGTNFIVSYNELASNTPALFASSNSWVYDDGTGIGTLTFAASDTTTTWSYDGTGDWTWAIYADGNATTGALRGAVAVNVDGSGSARLYCATDGLLRSQLTWTTASTGQFCTYVTACSPNGDRPCVAYP